MGGKHHSVTNTVVNTTTTKNINQTTDNNMNNHATTNQTNTYNNVLTGDKVSGGMLTSQNTVNSGTALYKLQNLSVGYSNCNLDKVARFTPEGLAKFNAWKKQNCPQARNLILLV